MSSVARDVIGFLWGGCRVGGGGGGGGGVGVQLVAVNETGYILINV